MANGILCDNRLVTQSGVTFTHSTEVSGYPAENVQIYQPGESFRTSVLDGCFVNFVPSGPVSVDTFAALYTNATPHRNLAQQSNTLNTSPWTKTNVTVTEGNTNTSISGAGSSCRVIDDATNSEHSVEQDWTSPTSFEAEPTFTLSAYFAEPASIPITEVRLRMEEGANYAHVLADISAGTVGSVSVSGFTGGSATITAVDSSWGSLTWYRVTLTATAPDTSPGTITTKINLASGGAVSYSGTGDYLHVEGLMLEIAASAQAPPISVTTTDTGALWGVGSQGTVDGVRAWGHVVNSDMTGQDWIHLIHHEDSPVSSITFIIRIYDPNNLDGYIEIGNLVIAKSFQPTYNISNDWTIGWAEDGSSQRAPGAQLYRPVNKRYRTLSMKHEWLSETEAMEEAFEIDRRVGRSEGVLAVVDPASDYAHQWAVWGVQETLDGVTHRRWVPSLSTHVYAKEWNIVEALP
jgi:hypothetical protein